MLHTRMTTLPSLLFALSPFVIFDSDYPFMSALYIKDPLEYFYDTFINCRTRPDEM